ncbi:MAG: hypothetical protein HC769_25515 [Cyanobacteria bacterium CRU_2_1]|nr:hypothetical protein [Cyanobacteria bacterium RU_5_0]NJR61891.1 hypothetical protein [Cyanobacteria bacterium CRU_2_1]
MKQLLTRTQQPQSDYFHFPPRSTYEAYPIIHSADREYIMLTPEQVRAMRSNRIAWIILAACGGLSGVAIVAAGIASAFRPAQTVQVPSQPIVVESPVIVEKPVAVPTRCLMFCGGGEPVQ